MATLMGRNLDQRLVPALKKRASAHGRSAEAEHRAPVEQWLSSPPKRSFEEVIAEISDVGLDEDFRRVEGGTSAHVFV